MNNRIAFSALRDLLLDLGLKETPYEAKKPLPSSHLVFEHPSLGLLLVVPKQHPRAIVDPATMIAVRKQLVENGLLEAKDFENLLQRASA